VIDSAIDLANSTVNPVYYVKRKKGKKMEGIYLPFLFPVAGLIRS